MRVMGVVSCSGKLWLMFVLADQTPIGILFGIFALCTKAESHWLASVTWQSNLNISWVHNLGKIQLVEEGVTKYKV